VLHRQLWPRRLVLCQNRELHRQRLVVFWQDQKLHVLCQHLGAILVDRNVWVPTRRLRLLQLLVLLLQLLALLDPLLALLLQLLAVERFCPWSFRCRFRSLPMAPTLARALLPTRAMEESDQ